ncbi:serine hydrolase domain-containing protein [Paenibacillus spongiae]|uniref:Beta-lactamase family protein n=1 Tax=Paenibacillus spongiae TaxID=2909671 RepID=A0ABY5S8S5_9BACL|nr:serine hydrolase domain-containing protein [Paenibacillus spongiae]UVI29200.1 beta-lactamase family protein [Paenibacillus spongiae]
MQINASIEAYNRQESIPFSGAVWVGGLLETLLEQSYGYANRGEQIRNTTQTRFGMASGCKIFTAVAICQLVEQGRLALDTRLKDCLPIPFPVFDPEITVHHLLTHSSGIPDYFDEEFMNDYGDLWKSRPMYAMTSAECFLPMFQHNPMKFTPGERFSYSNAGFILLGLIVEHIAGTTFQQYVEDHIFNVCGMKDSGYFRLDQLPERTAWGYIDSGSTWRTNMYSIPIVGGPDGGAFTTVHDMRIFWTALMDNRLLSKHMTEIMLTPHIQDNEFIHYGYGVWIVMVSNKIFKYFVMGSDPGVEMQSSIYAESKLQAHILANINSGAGAIATRIDELILAENS